VLPLTPSWNGWGTTPPPSQREMLRLARSELTVSRLEIER
jgi:hypothetical protein